MTGGNVINLPQRTFLSQHRAFTRSSRFAEVSPTIDEVHAMFVRVARPRCPPPPKESRMVLRLADTLAMIKGMRAQSTTHWPLALEDDARRDLEAAYTALAPLEDTLAEHVFGGGAHEVIHQVLSDVHNLRDLIPRVLAATHPPVKRDWRDDARMIANLAVRAWEDANGDAPVGTGANTPLVMFVGFALRATGWSVAPSTVRAALEAKRPPVRPRASRRAPILTR